jgi:hypothetical protein
MSNPLASFEDLFHDFFEGIDECISYHVRPYGIGFGEVACTELLAMCLSTQDSPLGLRFTATQLSEQINDGLRELGVDTKFRTNLSFKKFSQNHEGAVTQSDFAIRIIAEDSSDPRKRCHEHIYFFQAKILKTGEKYDASTDQQERIDIIRKFVGRTGLLYCLYNSAQEAFPIAIAAGHPAKPSDPSLRWSRFMTELLLESYGVGEQRVTERQGQWRRLLFGNNSEANRRIAKLLGKEDRRWSDYTPTTITFEADFPAYEYRNALAAKLKSAPPSAPGYGSLGDP